MGIGARLGVCHCRILARCPRRMQLRGTWTETHKGQRRNGSTIISDEMKRGSFAGCHNGVMTTSPAEESPNRPECPPNFRSPVPLLNSSCETRRTMPGSITRRCCRVYRTGDDFFHVYVLRARYARRGRDIRHLAIRKHVFASGRGSPVARRFSPTGRARSSVSRSRGKRLINETSGQTRRHKFSFRAFGLVAQCDRSQT